MHILDVGHYPITTNDLVEYICMIRMIAHVFLHHMLPCKMSTDNVPCLRRVKFAIYFLSLTLLILSNHVCWFDLEWMTEAMTWKTIELCLYLASQRRWVWEDKYFSMVESSFACFDSKTKIEVDKWEETCKHAWKKLGRSQPTCSVLTSHHK